jgi:5-methylcytosine-specific restriction protein A
MRVCNVPTCPTIYEGNQGRCPEHRRQARAKRVDNAVYSTRGHRVFRDTVLTRDPICTACGIALSTVADHYPRTRRELEALNLNPNDPQYGRGLCATCHNRHTARTSPGGWHT